MSKIHFFIAKCLAVLIFYIPFAYSQIRPNETDLKSTYCIEYIKISAIPKLNSLIVLFEKDALSEHYKDYKLTFEEGKKEMQLDLEKTYQDLHRLQSYLVPRIRGMDVLGLELAQNRAREDLKLVNSCDSKCIGNPKPNPDLLVCIKSCLKSIGNPDERGKACRNINFLPF